MARPPAPARTALGFEVRKRRAGRESRSVAAEIGLAQSTLSHVEGGTHAPSLATALKLAKWLGWTVEQVVEAAGQAAPESGPEGGL